MNKQNEKTTNEEKAKSLGVTPRTLYRWKRDNQIGQSDNKDGHDIETLAELKMQKLKKEIEILEDKKLWQDYARIENVFLCGMKCQSYLGDNDTDKWLKIKITLLEADIADKTNLLEIFNGLEEDEKALLQENS